MGLRPRLLLRRANPGPVLAPEFTEGASCTPLEKRKGTGTLGTNLDQKSTLNSVTDLGPLRKGLTRGSFYRQTRIRPGHFCVPRTGTDRLNTEPSSVPALFNPEVI